MCVAALSGGYWATVISPVFVMVLTLGISGVPMQVWLSPARATACIGRLLQQ